MKSCGGLNLIKERARYTPSQTVFHNVCSGAHRALFCLSYLVSKKRHKVSTPNCVPQVFGNYYQRFV